ncbi:exonuclease domain-containing protein [Pseudarthrobacter sp. J1738]|uniref:exonuclease domain-containing protein n=1 Tax=unclassified Pseudarthrobacter TaxID=2647000 RepID=UPI003D2970EB
MALDFTAIDFETANGFRGSPCSVGLSKVRDGKVVDEAYWLIRPPEGHDHFEPRNIEIHGIYPEDVAQAPRFGEVFNEVSDFIGGDILAAHNAAFDLGVIRSGLEVSGLPGPAFDYVCTVILSRRCYSLVSNSLPFAAREAGVPLLNHHDALEDARACAGILIDIAGRHQASSVPALFSTLGMQQPRQEAFDPAVDELSKPSRSALEERLSRSLTPETVSGYGAGVRQGYWPVEGPNPAPNLNADPAHPLFGQRIVFTGNLGLPRPEAKRRAAQLGAAPDSRVTKSTNVLVVGDGFVAADLRSGRVTGKARRVLELHDQGQHIEVVSEGEFLQMLGGEWPANGA